MNIDVLRMRRDNEKKTYGMSTDLRNYVFFLLFRSTVKVRLQKTSHEKQKTKEKAGCIIGKLKLYEYANSKTYQRGAHHCVNNRKTRANSRLI